MAANGEVRNSDTVLKPITNTEVLETVRVLHKTVVSLRQALERSRSEVHLLKSKIPNQQTVSKYNSLVEHLALENHVLRRRILSSETDLLPMEASSNPLPGSESDEESISKTERREQYEVRVIRRRDRCECAV